MTGHLKKPLYIIGGGDHGLIVVSVAQAMGYQDIHVFDDNQSAWGRDLLGVEVKGPVPDSKWWSECDGQAFLAIGHNSIRETLDKKLAGVNWATLIHPDAFVHESAMLAPGVLVNPGVIVQPLSKLGRHVILNTGCIVEHHGDIGDYVHIAPAACLAGQVKIGARSFICTGANIVPYVQLAEDCLVAAGSTVTRNLSKGAKVGGVPARPIA